MSTFNKLVAEDLISKLQKESEPFLGRHRIKFFSPKLSKDFFRTDLQNFFDDTTIKKNNDIFLGQVLLSDRAGFTHMQDYSKSILERKEEYEVQIEHEDIYKLLRKDFHNQFVTPRYQLETVNTVAGLLLFEQKVLSRIDDQCRIGNKEFRSILLAKQKKENNVLVQLHEEFYKVHLSKHFFDFVEENYRS